MPAASITALDESAREKKRRRGIIGSVIVGAIVVHLAGLFVAGVVIVAKFFAEPKATFEIPREIRVPVQTRDHKMTMAKNEAIAPKPSFNDRLVSTRPTNFALPEMPKIDMDQLLPLDPSEIVSDQISSLVGSAGLGSGAGSGALGSGGIGGTGLSFFGLKTEGSRILLIFDVSTSVVNKATKAGIPLARIKEETINLIDKLPINARFSIVQFVRNYKPFTEELLVASPPNKDLARQWIETEWSDTGMMAASGKGVKTAPVNGLPLVLDFAFTLKPDTIFIISDGSFQQTTPASRNHTVTADEFEDQLKRLQDTVEKPVLIHFIGFEMKPEDQSTWRRLSQRSGGKLREIK
ncbi:hypothetical protein FEM03_02195 [Phragmitibacter flavus]|uniref:VWFA domain-containing protein n=1 Tax=Phragmitibacter flavus TaxID=2576071 RepID=A0A5R8KKP9_9BACT|nr:hypothetical protein [Phragmitibacter flavus]TLD72189.1 hypothetical protein FEM03_02195 [Phragmitibacter flavus]